MARTFVLKSFLIATLRRASYRYPGRSQAMTLARVERGKYRCASCQGIFGNKDINVDHIEPVVPLTGFTDWNSYIARMFPPVEGFQILCESCHDQKTKIEQDMRKDYKKRSKPKKAKK